VQTEVDGACDGVYQIVLSSASLSPVSHNNVFDILPILLPSYISEDHSQLNPVTMGSVMLQHLPSAWHVDQAIVRFLHSSTPPDLSCQTRPSITPKLTPTSSAKKPA